MSAAAAFALAEPTRMIVASDLLGPLDVEADDVIQFASGLFGFPECREFVVVPAEREGLFWIQSVEHSTLAFLLVDPFVHVEGYSVDLGAADRVELGVADAADVVLLAIVTLPRSRDQRPTANLQGPIAINLRTRRAKQIALPDATHEVRHPIDLERTG